MMRTRFSPSPTGMLHLGNVRTALFSALLAVKEHGSFILRIEDTDQSRSEKKFADLLIHDLHWLGIQWQEGPQVEGPYAPYWQSERQAIYARYYQEIEESGRAYPCFCSEQELTLNRKLQISRGQAPRYPGTCRTLAKEMIMQRLKEGKHPALRFLVPTNTLIEFTDLVKGPQRFNSDDIGDFIIRRADGTSSFMFCNAIDDSVMEITHVLRGEDHLANTPRQLMILQALNMRTPQYAHLSLITSDDSMRLSKRRGSFSLHDLREEGYLSKAVINYLARLTHTYDEQMLMDFSTLARSFRIERLSRSPARFDRNQLLHWQKEAVLALDTPSLWDWLGETTKTEVAADKRDLFASVMQKNILFPEEARKWADILFVRPPDLSTEKIDLLKQAGPVFFNIAISAVKQHKTDLKLILVDIKEKSGLSGKTLFLPLRIALTGEEHGPELAHILELLGPKEVLQRLERGEKS